MTSNIGRSQLGVSYDSKRRNSYSEGITIAVEEDRSDLQPLRSTISTPDLRSGFSLKEMQERLSELRGQNFGLKLQVHLSEERLQEHLETVGTDTYETIVNLRLKIDQLRNDNENLQRDLSQAHMEVEDLKKNLRNSMENTRKIHRNYEADIEEAIQQEIVQKIKAEEKWHRAKLDYEKRIRRLEFELKSHKQQQNKLNEIPTITVNQCEDARDKTELISEVPTMEFESLAQCSNDSAVVIDGMKKLVEE